MMRLWGKTIQACSVVFLVCGIAVPRADAGGPAFRAIHLLNLQSEADETAVLGALARLNQAMVKEGYPQVRYRLWKVDGVQQGTFSHLLESTWPDRQTYEKIHDSASYREASEAVRPVVDKSLKGETYNRYVELVAPNGK